MNVSIEAKVEDFSVKDQYKIEIHNWLKHNPKSKKGYTHFMVSKSIFNDEKIANLKPIEFQLYMYLLSVCADMASNQFRISAQMLPRYMRISAKSLHNYLTRLQLFQILTAVKIDPLIEENRKEENRKEVEEDKKPENPDNNEKQSAAAEILSFNENAGAIEPFSKSRSELLLSALTRVPKSVQNDWINIWGKSNSGWVLKVLEKTVLKRTVAGAGVDEDWGSTFTAWLGTEKDQPPISKDSKAWVSPTDGEPDPRENETLQKLMDLHGAKDVFELMKFMKESHGGQYAN